MYEQTDFYYTTDGGRNTVLLICAAHGEGVGAFIWNSWSAHSHPKVDFSPIITSEQ